MSENVLVELVQGIFMIIGIFASAYVPYSISKKSKPDECSNIVLTSHHIFSKIEFNKNVIKTRFKLDNKGKEVLFKDILLNHLDIYKRHILVLIDELEEKDASEFYNLSVNTLNDIITEINNFYKDSSNYTREEKRVLNIVMAKYNHWNEAREREFLERIQEVCVSKVYQDNKIKSFLILDTFMFLVNDIVADGSKTLNKINGDLRGLKFKGVVI